VPKLKPPPWLTTAFAEGVVELAPPRPAPAYKGALGRCWLAQHDERRRPCSGRFERCHAIPRQRVENALWALLPGSTITGEHWPAAAAFATPADVWDLILLAAWDPRNAVIGCGDEHHPRWDGKQGPPLIVRRDALPDHVIDFAAEWGLESQLELRFPQ